MSQYVPFLTLRNHLHPLLKIQTKAHLEPSGRRCWLGGVHSLLWEQLTQNYTELSFRIKLLFPFPFTICTLRNAQWSLWRHFSLLFPSLFLTEILFLPRKKAFLSLPLFPSWHEVFNHNQFADKVVWVSCVCLSVSSPGPDCQTHALDNVDTFVNKFCPASEWKCGYFSLGSFFIACTFLDDFELDVLCLASAAYSVVLPVIELTLLLARYSVSLETQCEINSLSHYSSSAGKHRRGENKANLPSAGGKGVWRVFPQWTSPDLVCGSLLNESLQVLSTFPESWEYIRDTQTEGDSWCP